AGRARLTDALQREELRQPHQVPNGTSVHTEVPQARPQAARLLHDRLPPVRAERRMPDEVPKEHGWGRSLAGLGVPYLGRAVKTAEHHQAAVRAELAGGDGEMPERAGQGLAGPGIPDPRVGASDEEAAPIRAELQRGTHVPHRGARGPAGRDLPEP